MAGSDSNTEDVHDGFWGWPVLAKRVVSRPGARVTETVYDLSEQAARRLQTGGKIPPR